MAKMSANHRPDWEKARAVVRANRAKLRRRKGVVGVKVTHRFDERGEPSGLPEITIEVAEKLPEAKLRKNQRLPTALDGFPVSVVDIRGQVPMGDRAEVLRPSPDSALDVVPLAATALDVTAAGVLAPAALATVKPGAKIVSTGRSFGSLSAVVFSNGRKFLLTCSHVLPNGGNPLQRVQVGLLDGSGSVLPIGETTDPTPPRGHDSSHDCVLVDPSIPQDRIDYEIDDPILGGKLEPESNGHYRSERITEDDVEQPTPVFHVGAVSPGSVGFIVDDDGSLDATGSTPSTPITTGLIVIRPKDRPTFSEPGDSGGLILNEDGIIVGMVIGLRRDGNTVGCHFDDVVGFFEQNSFPISL